MEQKTENIVKKLNYNNQELTQIKVSDAGKNAKASPYNGIYRAPNDDKFFIKKPTDPVELFTELFAGLLLEEFKKADIFPKEYHDSLVCAKWIKLPDEEGYALIQPLVNLTEAFKIMGTGYSDEHDRNPFLEVLFGGKQYIKLTQNIQSYGLSFVLMVSLWIGDYSVHSGNLAFLDYIKRKPVRVGRFDFGAAFRYFADPENNQNILENKECIGLFNLANYTKRYILNFKHITGLYEAIRIKAENLQIALALFKRSSNLNALVNNALINIPAQLITPEVQGKLTELFCIKEFNNIKFGSEKVSNTEGFVNRFVETLENRLVLIQNLKSSEQIQINAHKPYQSFISSEAKIFQDVQCNIKNDDFIRTIKEWTPLHADRNLVFDPNETQNLIVMYNKYLEGIVQRIDETGLFKGPQNILSQDYIGNHELNMRAAFVPQTKESLVLKKLYYIQLNSTGSGRLRGYDNALENFLNKERKDEQLLVILGAINLASLIVRQIQVINNLRVQESPLENGEMKMLVSMMLEFNTAQERLDKLLNSSSQTLLSTTVPESKFFYPFTQSELEQLTSAQLITICLEEVSLSPDFKPSTLLNRIYEDHKLFKKVFEGIETYEAEIGKRADNPREKIKILQSLRLKFITNNFHQSTKLGTLKPEDLQFLCLEESKLPNNRVITESVVSFSDLWMKVKENNTSLVLMKARTEFVNSKINLSFDAAKKAKTVEQFISAVNKINQLQVQFDCSQYESCKQTSQEYFKKAENFKNLLENHDTCKNIILNARVESLDEYAIEDINRLKLFYTNENDRLGNDEGLSEYNTELQRFYLNAVEIRLSGRSIQRIKKEIIEEAHNQFSHRDQGARLIADVLMIVACFFGGLGLIVGFGNILWGKPFLFSMDNTQRQKNLEAELDLESNDRLFKASQ